MPKLSNIERFVIIGAILIVWLFVITRIDILDRFSVFLSFSLYTVLLAIPFLFPLWRASIFHPLIFFVLWFNLRFVFLGKMFLPLMEFGPSHSFYFSEDYVLSKVFVLDSLSLIFAYLGYILAPSSRVRIKSVDLSNFGIVASFWAAVSVLGFFVLLWHAGSLENLLMQRGLRSDYRIVSQIGGHWVYISGLALVISITWFAIDNKALKNPLFWLFTILSLLMKLAATGSRGGLLAPLLMLCIIHTLRTRKIPYKFVFITILISWFAVPLLGNFRTQTMKVNSINDVYISLNPVDLSVALIDELSRRYADNSGQLFVIGSVPHSVSYLYGESYAAIPFIFIPSFVVDEKPQSVGSLTAKKIFNRSFTAIPPGAVAEAYWNLSYWGVMFIFLIYGFVLKFVMNTYMYNRENPFVVVFFSIFLLYFVPHTESIYDFFHLLSPVVIIYISLKIMEIVRKLGKFRF